MKIHFWDYLILVLIFLAGLFFFSYFRYNQTIQIGCVIVLSIAYFLWGIVHHYQDKTLYLKVIIEYLLIAFLGAILIISLILRK